MSRTATRDDRTPSQQAGPAAIPLVPPPKLRRRRGLTATAVVTILLGGLVAAWAWTATSKSQDVLVAQHSIPAGSVIAASDLTRARISSDPAISPVPASALDDVVGKRATYGFAAGTPIAQGSYSSSVMPGGDNSLVGVALTPAQEPGQPLRIGDHVRVVVTPGQGGSQPAGLPPVSDAQVAGVHIANDTGATVVDLLVPHDDAPLLAARAATGDVALILDTRER